MFILAIPPEQVFSELYFSDSWQAVFAFDNSFVVWGVLLAFMAWRRSVVGIAFAGAALLHLGLDFPFHHDDARRHFWPLTDWVFVSPLSYWDPNHHGGWIGALELGAALAVCIWLWRRFVGTWARLGILLLALAEALPLVIWALVMAG